MTYEQNEKEYASKGVAGAGLGLGIAGTALGLFASHWGGFNGNASSEASKVSELMMENSVLKSQVDVDKKLVDVYTSLRLADKTQDEKVANLSSRVLALETASPLKEQIFDGKIAQVYDKITCCCNSATAAIANTNAGLASLQSLVGSLTKTIIPIDNVCPEPMQRYNSWVQPTSPTTSASK